FVQPETFLRRRIWETVGEFRTDLKNVFDYEYWCRMLLAGAVIRQVDAEFAYFRLQPVQKSTNSKQTADEELSLLEKWLWDPDTPLTRRERRRLQAHWIYDCVFRRIADDSLRRGHGAFRRRLQLALMVIRYPRLWSVPHFRARIAASTIWSIGL